MGKENNRQLPPLFGSGRFKDRRVSGFVEAIPDGAYQLYIYNEELAK